MPKTINAILIDPFACEIKPVEVTGDLRSYYAALSHESMPVDCFTAVFPEWMDNGDAVFVDDEGLFKMPERFFCILGVEQPLAGKGLIVGSRPGGDAAAVKTSIEEVRASVVFARPLGRSFIRVTAPWVKEIAQ